MKYNFLNIFLDKKELLQQDKKDLNQILLDNNSSQIEKLYEFYKSDSSLLCLNGFIGTGKIQIVEHSLSFLSSDAIVLKYNCFASTILDDILLSFFSDFKKLSAQKIISEPKTKTENFSQKINSYFSLVEKPFVIVLDSFEAILKENRQEILDFIFHLLTYSKIKIILISRAFEESYFENQGINYERITTLALEKSLFEKYLRSEKIKSGSLIIDEFYRYTRGYYLYTRLSLKIMQQTDKSLMDFMKDFKSSFATFDEFLNKRAMDLIPATSRNIFWFLSMIRHPVSISLLKTLKLYDEEKINFLKDNLVICQDDSLIYVQDYFKEQVEIAIAPNIAQRIRQYILDLYQTQLPLKPLERNILISRQAMRKEIEYHQVFLPKKPMNIENQELDINYMTYAKGLDFEYDYAGHKPKEAPEESLNENKPEPTYKPYHMSSSEVINMPNIEINLKDLPFKLSKEEMSLLEIEQGKLDNETPLPTIIDKPSETVVKEDEVLNLGEILEQAKKAEAGYHYSKQIELYKEALKNKDFEINPEYAKQLPFVYTKLAHAYHKIADYDNALKYYDLAQKFYEKSNELVKANYIKLNISKIFYETYKFDRTRETLLDIVKFKDNPAILNTKTYLQLANLENNLSNLNGAFEFYKKAVELSNETMDIETLSELYFKYALILDDKSNSESAIVFYKKCIDLSDDYKLNKFLSSAYSNIATLYLEKNDTTLAVKNYLKAYEIDEKNNNFDGMYYSASKLASVLQKKYPEEAIKFYEKALHCAKSLNDIFYIASSSLAVGDFYSDRKKDETALQYYISALDLVKNEFSKDNIDKIKVRINDIKFRLGEETFESVVKKIREKKV